LPFTALLIALAPLDSKVPLALAADAASGAGAPAAMPQEKLDSILAPIALYPDQLLTQILMASTYPLDVVEAARFVKANKDLKGDALDKAVAEKKWDPSVQSLTAFPQVLNMMNEKLEWTQELGDAFLADQKRVMNTVQTLRQKALAAGNLKSNEQQKVVTEQKIIIIEPAKTEVVYVPTYNPTVVYGVWWAPMYPPYYYPPPPYYYPGYHAGGAFVIGFSIGIAISNNHWGWCHPHWHGGSINININKNNVFIKNNNDFRARVDRGGWQHNPAQRKGVAYRDASTRDQYRKVDANAVSARRNARGYEPGGERPQPGPGADRRVSQRPSEPARAPDGARAAGRSTDTRPAFDAGQSRQQARDFSKRGAASRGTIDRGGTRGR
jgi:hypothetical protein